MLGYDNLQHLQSATLPSLGDAAVPVWSHTYDALGRTTSTTDPLGNLIGIRYDHVARIVTTTLPPTTPLSDPPDRATCSG